MSTTTPIDAVPDDGHRYELIDGTLVVTPAPSIPHQTVVVELTVLLRRACPDHLKVLVAPLDIALADDTVLQPDVLVARRVDLMLKRSRYEAAGCPAYWVIDPDEPSLTAWELRGQTYVEVAHIVGDEEYAARTPYPIIVTPGELLV